MKRWLQILLILMVPMLPCFLYAGSAPQVRVDPGKPADTLYVGQRIAFSVILYSPTFFAGVPAFDLPPVSGAMLMKVPDRPVVGSEEIDGHTFSSQRHEFALYPQKPGPITVPSLRVRFGVAGTGGAPAVEHTLQTDEFQLAAQMPPGAEKLGALISTSQLTVKETWAPTPVTTKTAGAKVGDAFTRTVTFEAADIPGMAFPPLPRDEIAGVAMYPQAPQVKDDTQRGEFTGKRVEALTYVMEAPGTVILPAMVFAWYNLSSRELQKIELPAVSLTVDAAPVSQTDEPTPSAAGPLSKIDPRIVGGLALLILVLAAVLVKYGPAIGPWWTAGQARRWRSEPAYFARLCAECQHNSPAKAYQALMAWLEQVLKSDQTVSLGDVFQKHPHAALADALERLQTALVDPQRTYDCQALPGLLKAYRKQLLSVTPESLPRLPDLNPR